MPASLLAAWCARPEPRPVLMNGYGPTETTIAATARVITPDRATWSSIGAPLTNVRTYVLDEAGEPAPIGVAGELYIGGVQVARGYLNKPALTAERFVPNPFEGTGSRLYRTGDLARWRADGELDFLGRTDGQVKLRGYRVELGEIEAVLAAHPAVARAVVVARDDAAGERQLVAYCVATESATPNAEVLRAYLAERLPAYMVPAAYVTLDALPLMPSGKIDRKGLPSPDSDAYQHRAYEAPIAEIETALAGIWAELLDLERVGRHDDFFALGGHSLLAVRLVARARHVLGVELGVADVFRTPVLSDLARAVSRATQAGLSAIETIRRDPELGVPLEPPPLSFAQQRLWFLEQMGGLGSMYHVTWPVRLRGTLDRGALRHALDQLVARHEALRTTFATVAGEPVQRIAPIAGRTFTLIEQELSGPDVAARLQVLVREETEAPFDLTSGPLIRGRLIRIDDRDPARIDGSTTESAPDHALVITMHHIVSDGWSLGIFADELRKLYVATRDGRSNPLPPLPVQYADYAAWQRRALGEAALAEQTEYWRQTLADIPERLELPADRARPAVQEHAGDVVPIRIGADVTKQVRALSARRGTTMFMTVLAGWATVLSRLSGQTDVVIGIPAANRNRLEIEPLIGLFLNTLALRIELAGDPTIAELLQRVKTRALGAQQHQDVPFEQVIEEVKPVRSLAHSPVFQVMFAWQNALGGRATFPGVEVRPLGTSGRVNAMFELSLALSDVDGQLMGNVEYATALWDRATIERHVGYLGSVLRAMAADDSVRVSELPLLSAAERSQVVEVWNATAAPYPCGVCVPELFAAQVARTPDAVAVAWEPEGDRIETLTYARLASRVRALARALRARGVGAETRVVVCLERSPALLVALLGVLEAGGTYVPLDPEAP
ncbi:MAG: condensation domain-containing protein, partial [Gemmatimonadaceae bacterium]